MTEGYLYCLSNSSMPDLLKVGMTERTPEERLNEANSSSTFKPPTPYKIEFAKKVKNVREKERLLHKILERYRERPNQRREFFKVSLEEVKDLFDLLDGEVWEPTLTEAEEEIQLLTQVKPKPMSIPKPQVTQKPTTPTVTMKPTVLLTPNPTNTKQKEADASEFIISRTRVEANTFETLKYTYGVFEKWCEEKGKTKKDRLTMSEFQKILDNYYVLDTGIYLQLRVLKTESDARLWDERVG